jgi:hypothetical protein
MYRTASYRKEIFEMADDLWVKPIEHQDLKPLDDWRDDLYGFWMVVTGSTMVNGVKMAVARYYGTDTEKLHDICAELWGVGENDAQVFCNKKNNWMGGAFLVKADS